MTHSLLDFQYAFKSTDYFLKFILKEVEPEPLYVNWKVACIALSSNRLIVYSNIFSAISKTVFLWLSSVALCPPKLSSARMYINVSKADLWSS